MARRAAFLTGALALVWCGSVEAQSPPFGGEFQINTYTTSGQVDPAIASSGNQKFVVVWSSFGQDGDRGGIFGQRFDGSGNKIGSEFPVNSYTTGHQSHPSIAMAKDGSFVVAWESYQDLTGTHHPIPPSDIFARRFASDATPLGDDFQVNTYTTGYQYRPAVAIDDSREFVVVWSNAFPGRAVGRRYDASGAPTGDEFPLSLATTFATRPCVAMAGSGEFVAVWNGERPVVGLEGVFGQRFDADGTRLGGEFEVDTETTGDDTPPRVALDRHGNFIVVWSAFQGEDRLYDVSAQRYNRSAEKVGPLIAVNTYTPDEQSAESVAIASDGKFLVSWDSYRQDGSSGGVFAQEFDRTGGKLGGEIPMNTFTTSEQSASRVAFDGSGYVVAWDSYPQDGSGSGIIGRRQTIRPRGIGVDGRTTPATSSDENGVLEPGEIAFLSPLWSNDGPLFLGDLSGTSPLLFCVLGFPCVIGDDRAADYGTLAPHVLATCDDGSPDACYTVSAGGARPGTHWDGFFREDLSAGGGNVWTLHVGDSFSDVPRSQPFYRKIETMLHFGITSGCDAGRYCPTDAVPRDQMAIFIAKALAGAGEYVPTTGNIKGIPFGSSFDCAPGGNSLFLDVAPTDSFCRHVHYLASRNVTLGCGNFRYCPAPVVTRDVMASFIAKAVVAPGGGDAVPLTYGPDPNTSRSYSCAAGSPNVHFTDVPVSSAFCKHIHYLWAKGIVAGCSATKYCPTAPVARDAMAKFIANGFGLQLYEP